MRSRCWLHGISLLSCVGCIDPKARFDAFNERLADKQARERDAEVVPPPPEGDAGSCATAEMLAGTYYWVMRPSLAPDALITLLLTLEYKGSDELDLAVQPLLVDDRKTPVGAPSKGKFLVKGQAFEVPPFEVHIPGAADAVLPGTDLVVQATMSGYLCAEGDAASFVCGAMGGMVTVPAVLSLEGSTFGAHRIVAGEPLPPLSPSCAEREGVE